MKTLVILSSILGDRSHSKQLADHLVARVKQAEPAAVITTRNIGAAPLPYFDGATVARCSPRPMHVRSNNSASSNSAIRWWPN